MSFTSMQRLANDLEALSPRIVTATNELKKQVAVALVADEAANTPIDTGRAISNWQASVGTAAETVIDPYFESDTGSIVSHHPTHADLAGAGPNTSAAVDAAQAAVETAEPGQPIFVVNNTPYIGYLNDGHSKQAQSGFIEASILRVSSTMARAKLPL